MANRGIRAQGIVLKETKYQDTSKILSIYTLEHGKIQAMAKGAYKPKSGLTGSTQVFSQNEYEIHRGKTFYHINQGHIINSFYSIREKMERIYYGYYMLELLDKSLEKEDSNKRLFLLLVKGLKILSELEKNFLKFIVAYELKFISFIGYRPNIDTCVLCGSKKIEPGKFSTYNGGIICRNCFAKDSSAINLDKSMYVLINEFLYTKLEDIEKINISNNALLRLHNILTNYILYNIDRRKFNSLSLINSLKD